MPIVPMLRPGQGGAQAQGVSPPPPDPVYALMAATQMHAEGRLLAQDRSGSDAKLASIPVAAQRPLRSL